jgi:PPOX class probable F420-dependent enzyme
MPSRRELIRMTDEEMDAFLAGRHTMSVATLMPDGRPHLVAMWYGFLDGAPAFWTYTKSQKVRNLERDARITCLVEEGESYDRLRGIELSGTGEVLPGEDAVMAVGRSVNERYNGPVTDATEEVIRQMGRKRVAVKIHVQRLVSWDHTKLGGTY